MSSRNKSVLIKIYQKLLNAFGPQHWWPGDSQFEIIIGAILTQNTNWGNVERAIVNLKKTKVLSPQKLHCLPQQKLASLIKPAGYFNVKAKRLKNFMNFLFEQYDGDLKKMQRQETKRLRHELLSVNGIGPETADSILLYAFNKQVFVVDAYTKRIFYRHNLVAGDATYHEIQDYFIKGIKQDVSIFNEYHALIVRLGKDFCKTKPRCEECPLREIRYSLTHRCPHCFRSLDSQEGACHH